MKEPAADRRPGVGGDPISRNAIFAFAAQMSTAAFTAALTIFLTRELGPAGYGVFALALSFTGLLRRPAAGGTSQAAARFVAERLGDTAAVTGVLGMALRIRLLSAGAIAAALFALAEPISALYDTPEMAWPLRVVSIAFIGQSLMNFWNNVFVASRRASSSFTLISSEAAMEFTASVALVLLGGGVVGAAAGRAVGYVFGAILGVFLVARLLGRSPLRRTGRSPVTRREFVGYSSVMLVVTSATTAFAQLDVLVIGALLTASAVGIYSAPLRLVGFLAYPGQALAQGVAPRLARHPDEPPAVRAAERGLRYMVMFQAGLVAVLLVWAEPFVRLVLGEEFLESAEVLRALTPYVLLNGMSALLVSPLNYAGEGRRRIPIAVATLVVAIAIDLALIPEIGILGAAVGTDVAFALYVGGHLWLCHTVLGLPLRGLAATAVRALAAAAALAGILVAFGTTELSALEWIGGLVLGGAAFVAALLATRAISVGELRSLAAMPRRALRRGSGGRLGG